MGLAVSPLCDREKGDLATSQLGFIQFVVRPSFVPFFDYCTTGPGRTAEDHALAGTWMAQLQKNTEAWEAEKAKTSPGKT